jgi:hypothetical protein
MHAHANDANGKIVTEESLVPPNLLVQKAMLFRPKAACLDDEIPGGYEYLPDLNAF